MSKIYKITNDINEKVYIGKTDNSLEKRFFEHCRDSERVKGEKRPLYNAMRKYGTEHFSIHLIEECDASVSSLREQYWIGYYKSYTEGYNATLGGDGKAYIDRQEIVDLWNSGKSLKEIVGIVNHDIGWVSHILQASGVDKAELTQRGLERISKTVLMLDKKTEEVLGSFKSTREAARFLAKQ